MADVNQSKPFILWFLHFLHFLLGVSALAGGVLLMTNPKQDELEMPLEMLLSTPFSSFFIPGLILFVFLGLFPILVFYGQITYRSFPIMNLLSFQHTQHWSWNCSIHVAIILIIWINSQIAMIGYWHPLQSWYALMGVLILILTFLPGSIKYYKIS